MKKNDRILSLAWKYDKSGIMLLLGAAFVYGIFMFFLMVIKGVVISKAAAFEARELLVFLAGYILLAVLIKIISICNTYFSKKMTRTINLHAKEEMLLSVQNLNLHIIEKKEIQNQLGSFEYLFQNLNLILQYCLERIGSIIYILGIICYVGYYSMFAGFVFCVFLFFCIMIQRKNHKFMQGFWEKYMLNAKRFNFISDIMIQRDYVEERKIFKTTRMLNKEFADEFDKAGQINKKNGWKRLGLDLGIEVCNFLMGIILIFIWVYLLWQHVFDIGKFVVLMENVFMVQALISKEMDKENKFNEISTIQKSFLDFLKINCAHGSKTAPFVEDKLEIAFHNVTFGYDKDICLHNFSYTFSGNQSYLLVGENGSGKTTLVKLLAGLYPAEAGEICINGTDIKEMDKEKLSKIIAVDFQDSCKYPLNLMENVVFSDQTVNLSKIENEYRDLDIIQHVKNLKEGWNTGVGELTETNTDLSGGEWQQLFFLRSVARETPVIVFDEPASSMDAMIEDKINGYIVKNLKEKLRIIVSHNLRLAKTVDKILVFQNGSLVESGTHRELIEKNGIYCKMYQTQKRSFM